MAYGSLRRRLKATAAVASLLAKRYLMAAGLAGCKSVDRPVATNPWPTRRRVNTWIVKSCRLRGTFCDYRNYFCERTRFSSRFRAKNPTLTEERTRIVHYNQWVQWGVANLCYDSPIWKSPTSTIAGSDNFVYANSYEGGNGTGRFRDSPVRERRWKCTCRHANVWGKSAWLPKSIFRLQEHSKNDFSGGRIKIHAVIGAVRAARNGDRRIPISVRVLVWRTYAATFDRLFPFRATGGFGGETRLEIIPLRNSRTIPSAKLIFQRGGFPARPPDPPTEVAVHTQARLSAFQLDFPVQQPTDSGRKTKGGRERGAVSSCTKTRRRTGVLLAKRKRSHDAAINTRATCS